MTVDRTQNFENHARLLPAYHYAASPLLLLNFLYAAYQAIVNPGLATAMGLALAVALILLLFVARTMPLTVQDRLIRLEERLRMRELLPADLQGRIGEFGAKQLVALRFASDEELPALARTVLDQKIEDPKAIKRMVKNWKADHLRA